MENLLGPIKTNDSHPGQAHGLRLANLLLAQFPNGEFPGSTNL